MKELVRVNGWERRITNAIKANKDNDKFPTLEEYGITRNDFDDYVVEKQYLLDRLEDRKSSFVVPGAILILPVIVISMFTDSVIGLFSGVAAGVVLAGGYMFTMNSIDKRNLRKMHDAKIEQYISDILNF